MSEKTPEQVLTDWANDPFSDKDDANWSLQLVRALRQALKERDEARTKSSEHSAEYKRFLVAKIERDALRAKLKSAEEALMRIGSKYPGGYAEAVATLAEIKEIG